MEDRFPAIRITMLPKDTNAFGTIFGGVILSYIDLAGAIEVRRHYSLRIRDQGDAGSGLRFSGLSWRSGDVLYQSRSNRKNVRYRRH